MKKLLIHSLVPYKSHFKTSLYVCKRILDGIQVELQVHGFGLL